MCFSASFLFEFDSQISRQVLTLFLRQETPPPPDMVYKKSADVRQLILSNARMNLFDKQ